MVAAAGLWLVSLPLLYTALFGLGVIAALFGPVKYGLLPDHLKRHELVAGNALVETATFLAILFGLVAGALAAKQNIAPQFVTFQLMAIALACYVTSCFIPPTGVAAANLRIRANILASTFMLLRELRGAPFLWRGALALSWFWLTGAVAISLVPVAVRHATAGGIEVEAAISGLVRDRASAMGSLVAARIARRPHRARAGPARSPRNGVFLLALGFATSGLLRSAQQAADVTLVDFLASPRGLFIGFDVVGLAAAGGLFTVPLFAAVQAMSPPERRARTIAAVNILNAVYIVAGTLVTALLQSRFFGLSEPLLLAALGVCNFAAAAYVQRSILPLSPHAGG